MTWGFFPARFVHQNIIKTISADAFTVDNDDFALLLALNHAMSSISGYWLRSKKKVDITEALDAHCVTIGNST